MLEEIWKPLPGWDNYYEVSNLGRARNRNTKKLKTLDINSIGYARVCCYNGSERAKFFIHIVVATLFLDPIPGFVVNHKDGDKTNNMVDNLEWVSRSTNNKHAVAKGLKKYTKGKQPCVLTTSDGTEIFFESIAACSRSIGITDKRLHHLIKTQCGRIPEIGAKISKCVSND